MIAHWGKVFVVSLLLVLALAVVPLAAGGASDDGEPKEDRETMEVVKPRIPYSRDTFQVTTKAGVGFNSLQWSFIGGMQFDYQPNPFLGLGLKTDVVYGLKFRNVNVNIYALYKIWWFYVGPGVSFLAQGMTLPAGSTEYVAIYPYGAIASLALTAGFRFPFVRIGPGHMVLDIALDWFQTDYPLTAPAPPLTFQTIDELINQTLYSFNLSFSLGYTF